MESPSEPEHKDRAAYLMAVMRKAMEYANQLNIDEPLLVVPKEWEEEDKEAE